MTACSRPFMATALGVALLLGGTAEAAKQTVTAVVGGHRARFKNKTVVVTAAGAEGVVFGGAQKPRRLGQLLKGLTVSCPIGLDSATFPVDGQFCVIGYSETRFSQNFSIKQWSGGPDGIRVTFMSFDGTRLRGTFEGTLAPFDPNGGYGPVTVQNGSFSVLAPQ